MQRSARAFVVFLLLAVVQGAFAQEKKDCTEVVFGGEVKAGETFAREIGNELTFRLDPWKDSLGWEFEIGPTHAEPNEWDQYVYTLTPPYRFGSARDVNTGWGRLAQDAIRGSHDFWFLLLRSDSKKASAALSQVLWPKNESEQQAGLKQLGALAKGRGEFHILDSKITPGTPVPGYGNCERGHCGAIHWIKFQVKLTVPRGFKPAVDQTATPAACPDWSKEL